MTLVLGTFWDLSHKQKGKGGELSNSHIAYIVLLFEIGPNVYFCCCSYAYL